MSSFSSQWLFPVAALLDSTPSRTTSSITVERELYDRARGVEFLFRLGVSLGLPSSAMYTAATWFHRFYMRFSMEDYHRQDVAAACIFLATKTEECGRKLRDVAKIYCSKVSRVKIEDIADNSSEVEESQSAILQAEEVLLEALCFDFVVTSPHSDLVDLLDARAEKAEVEEFAWTIANDSLRTPLCVLYPPRVIAAACYVLAQQYAEGPGSLSLAARIASPAPSASLPTPPSHKVNYSESARFALDFFNFNEVELASLSGVCITVFLAARECLGTAWKALSIVCAEANNVKRRLLLKTRARSGWATLERDALTILLEFYSAQDLSGTAEYLAPLATIHPPEAGTTRRKLYASFLAMAQGGQNQANLQKTETEKHEEQINPQPESTGSSSKSPSKGWKPVTGDTDISQGLEDGETGP